MTIRYNKKRNRSFGVTLTEVIISIALLSICIGAIISFLIQNLQFTQATECSYIALNIAKSRIEEMRQLKRDLSFADLDKYEETAWTPVDKHGEFDLEGMYRRKTEFAVPAGEANLKHITVTVSYKLSGMWSRVSVQLDTYISPYG